MDSAKSRFQDIASGHQRQVRQHLAMMEAEQSESSDEECTVDDENIINKMFTNYMPDGEKFRVDNIMGTDGYLMNHIKGSASICLICIETIRRLDPIWNCECCYESFHITCIQKWIKDGVYQQIKDNDDLDKSKVPWNCPKCRQEYSQSKRPTKYFCYCGKVEDPEFHPWYAHHSCGEKCEKLLKPHCGHQCLLLCHPGPCPPCPVNVKSKCYCQNSSYQVRRCSDKNWSCGKNCKKLLSCGFHYCENECHTGECDICPEYSLQKCLCGNNEESRPCADPIWQCTKVCGKLLSCRYHSCEKVCHSGFCGVCPRSENRNCPCGKSSFELPCTEEIPTCYETCEKVLQCGLHKCTEKCHNGPCGICRQITVKLCKCGLQSKEILCSKEYICDTKCNRIKDCHKHYCRKKCCGRTCQACELYCQKTLRCGSHKCQSLCHTGPCYPCTLSNTITCFCKQTKKTVPCGSKLNAKSLKCKLQCQIPPDCHHEKRKKHHCHFDNCPPCKKICYKAMTCGHECTSKCHSAVVLKQKENIKRAGPWDPRPKEWEEIVNKPCPPCNFQLQVDCLGFHEVFTVPCFESKVKSCGRQCGRKLPCCNHLCDIECHLVKDAPDELSCGTNCQSCELACEKPRLPGCKHICLLPCHPGDCPPCSQMIRMRCHCNLVLKHIECDKWITASEVLQIEMKCCFTQCTKALSCGHQCKKLCHADDCSKIKDCDELVKVKCPCKLKKISLKCFQAQKEGTKPKCDEKCQEKKLKEIQGKLKKREEVQNDQIDQSEDIETKNTEKKGKRHRNRNRNRYQEEPKQSLFEKQKYLIIFSFVAVIISITGYFVLSYN